MRHGAKNRSNTRKILNNNNVYTHTHTHTHARTHARTHPPTHTLFFWLTNNLKYSINYNKTKFLKQQNSKIETLNRIRLKPPYITPLNTPPHDGQTESLIVTTKVEHGTLH